MEKLFLGVVADDFTGASDAASFLTAAGVQTVLVNGIPERKLELPDGIRALVVALKSRTAPVQEAVEESLKAFGWLKEMGAGQLYLKYCSTFDSTDQGNIGPVVDAVMERYGYEQTVLCPSLPVNGRTVKNGILYVNGVKLEESSMKDHPLTPMRKSRISELMEKQGKYPCVEQGENYELPLNADTGRCYLVPDYYEEEHGDQIAEAFGNLPFLTGGSGLVGALGRRYVRRYEMEKTEACRENKLTRYAREQKSTSAEQAESQAAGDELTIAEEEKILLLAGSCSAMTLQQITRYQQAGHPSTRIIPSELLSGKQNLETFWKWVNEQESGALIYSSAEPEDLQKSQELGRERVASAIEHLLAGLAKKAVENGYTRIIVAGGETSGAVTKALGYDTFLIGPSVAPGVPVMTPLAAPQIRLVLKSGNFGQADFFERAVTFCRR